MEALNLILQIILVVVDLGLVILVLMQESKSSGMSGAIAGAAETFFGKKKANSLEGKLALWTKILAVVFIVLAIVLVILQ